MLAYILTIHGSVMGYEFMTVMCIMCSSLILRRTVRDCSNCGILWVRDLEADGIWPGDAIDVVDIAFLIPSGCLT